MPPPSCGATPLPVSGDLENGFGDAPETAAETIRLAADAGLVGASIEDATGDPDRPIYDASLAAERIAAAAEAARALPFPFTLTARAENFLYGRPDLDDTIRRLQAFEAAGADVLYAPGLRDLSAIRTVCGAVGKPVNVIMGLAGAAFSVDDLAAAGVRRISVGSAFARAALGAFLRGGPRGQGARHLRLRRRSRLLRRYPRVHARPIVTRPTWPKIQRKSAVCDALHKTFRLLHLKLQADHLCGVRDNMESQTMHPNARLIEKLYSSLRDDKPDAAAACYAGDAHFEDIAFWLNGRDCILQMWRLVCSQKVRVSFQFGGRRRSARRCELGGQIHDHRNPAEGHQPHHRPLRFSRRLDRQSPRPVRRHGMGDPSVPIPSQSCLRLDRTAPAGRGPQQAQAIHRGRSEP